MPKIIMKKTVLLLLLVPIFLCSSCVVSFKNPLVDSNTKTVDNRLLGKWTPAEAKKDEVYEFSKDENSNTVLKLVDGNNPSERVVFFVSTVQLGKYNYMSLKLITEDREDTFMIARYEIKGNEMNVSLPDKAKVREFIEQGKLDGGPKSYDEISVSNSTAEIRKFLESTESDAVFEEFGKLKKQ